MTSIIPSCARLPSSAIARKHAQALLPTIGRGVFRDLDAGHVEEAPRFLQEEAVGAADIEQPPAGAVFSNEIDGVGEFSPQHRLGAAIVGVAVRMPAGEIVAGIVGAGIETARLRAAEAALDALAGCRSRSWNRESAARSPGCRRGKEVALD